MGRKKRRRDALPFCYYCYDPLVSAESGPATFATEALLLAHQKKQHFACPDSQCRKSLISIHSLISHYFVVHEQQLKKVPNASAYAANDLTSPVFGMNHIPQHVLDEREQHEAEREAKNKPMTPQEQLAEFERQARLEAEAAAQAAAPPAQQPPAQYQPQQQQWTAYNNAGAAPQYGMPAPAPAAGQAVPWNNGAQSQYATPYQPQPHWQQQPHPQQPYYSGAPQPQPHFANYAPQQPHRPYAPPHMPSSGQHWNNAAAAAAPNGMPQQRFAPQHQPNRAAPHINIPQSQPQQPRGPVPARSVPGFAAPGQSMPARPSQSQPSNGATLTAAAKGDRFPSSGIISAAPTAVPRPSTSAPVLSAPQSFPQSGPGPSQSRLSPLPGMQSVPSSPAAFAAAVRAQNAAAAAAAAAAAQSSQSAPANNNLKPAVAQTGIQTTPSPRAAVNASSSSGAAAAGLTSSERLVYDPSLALIKSDSKQEISMEEARAAARAARVASNPTTKKATS